MFIQRKNFKFLHDLNTLNSFFLSNKPLVNIFMCLLLCDSGELGGGRE